MKLEALEILYYQISIFMMIAVGSLIIWKLMPRNLREFILMPFTISHKIDRLNNMIEELELDDVHQRSDHNELKRELKKLKKQIRKAQDNKAPKPGAQQPSLPRKNKILDLHGYDEPLNELIKIIDDDPALFRSILQPRDKNGRFIKAATT